MKYLRILPLLLLTLAIAAFVVKGEDDRFISYTADPKQEAIGMYWKDDRGKPYGSIANLLTGLSKQKKNVVFAMNGGMYMQDQTPLGLYIERGQTLQLLNTKNANGNFYLKPNGVFYLTDSNKAVVCKTEAFKANRQIRYATQSGPMLVIDGAIHPAFKQGSTNVNVRNGVGVLPDGKVVFAMSKTAVNFYDFALYFKTLGCKNALYLDGFVSRMYLPEKNWVEKDGNFGVMIAVTK